MLLAPAFASLLSGPLSVGGGLPIRPRAFRPSPSHRCAAGPSLYKRGCLRLRNSPAASRHNAPPAPPVCKTGLPAPETGPLESPVCKTGLPAPGTGPLPPPVCKIGFPAHGLLPAGCQLRAGDKKTESGIMPDSVRECRYSAFIAHRAGRCRSRGRDRPEGLPEDRRRSRRG